jgi:hypothetical protein
LNSRSRSSSGRPTDRRVVEKMATRSQRRSASSKRWVVRKIVKPWGLMVGSSGKASAWLQNTLHAALLLEIRAKLLDVEGGRRKYAHSGVVGSEQVGNFLPARELIIETGREAHCELERSGRP